MFSDTDSDLTDLSDSEEEEIPLASLYRQPAIATLPPKPISKPNANANAKVEKKSLGPRLQEPHLSAVNIDSIYRVVWDKLKQGALIDSTMHNFLIFPLVFGENPEKFGENGMKTKVCIDGKQRITALQLFRDGKIKIPEVHPVAYKQRVQNGVALQPSERLPAINGPHCDLVRDMRSRLSEGFRNHLGWTQSKGPDYLLLGQMVVLIKSDIAKPDSVGMSTEVNFSTVLHFLELKSLPSHTLRMAALHVIDVFNSIFEHPQLMDAISNIQRPWFVMAGFLVYRHGLAYSIGQLADAIRQMKAKVKQNKSAKPSARIYKNLFAFVKDVPNLTLVDKAPGAKLPTSMLTPSEHVQSSPPIVSMGTNNAKRTTQQKMPVKRKRVTKPTSDDEFVAGPISQKRAKTAKLPAYSSDIDDDGAVVREVHQIKPQPQAPCRVISEVVEKKHSSAAATKIKRDPSKVVSASKSPKGALRIQVGTPSFKPTRTKNPITAGAVQLPAAGIEDLSTQRTETEGEQPHQPTPSIPAANKSISPTLAAPLNVGSTSVALPPTTSRHASQLFNDHDSRPSTPMLKPEPRQSPVFTSYTPPPLSSSSSSGRLASLRAAKAKIGNKPPSISSSQVPMNPHHQSLSALPPSKDSEAELQAGLEQLSSLISSPVAQAPRRVFPISSSQQRPLPVVSTSEDVIIKAGIAADKNVLNDAMPLHRQRQPQSQFQRARESVSSIDTGSKVDQFQSMSKSGVSSNQGHRTPQSTAETAATLFPKNSYKGMAPIPKKHKPPCPVPTRLSRDRELSEEVLSYTESVSRVSEYDEGRHSRPSPYERPVDGSRGRSFR
ncbi:hypothetical protein H0H87_007595 [Tephrocybe sp. NHM501043]|nr:hypothetical protein H0H87_007595 [Tephrocybe sp. NHM501043]